MSSATAIAAMPSPRPMSPRPSFVVAFTLTRSGWMPTARAMTLRISADARGELRLLGDDGGVDVVDRELPDDEHAGGLFEERGAARVLPLGIAGREVGADVAHAGRAEQRVDDRVQENVGVGVAGEARLALERHAAEDERARGVEAVDVVADADSHGNMDKSQLSCQCP